MIVFSGSSTSLQALCFLYFPLLPVLGAHMYLLQHRGSWENPEEKKTEGWKIKASELEIRNSQFYCNVFLQKSLCVHNAP